MLTINLDTGHRRLTYEFEPTPADVRELLKYIYDRDVASGEIDPAIRAAIDDIDVSRTQLNETNALTKKVLTDNR